MTSDKTETQVLARRHLEYATGKHRVSLADLSPKYFDGFLEENIRNVDIRGLRCFAPLRSVLARPIRGDEPIDVAKTARFLLNSLSETSDVESVNYETINLNTQTVKVSRGVFLQALVYRRTESDESTTEWKVAQGWGRGAYLDSGTERILILARPSKTCFVEENLFAVDYHFAKVRHQNQYLIHTVNATKIPIPKFRDYFGTKAPDIARDLIWELGSLYSQTLSDLKSKTERMRSESIKWQRLSDSIS